MKLVENKTQALSAAELWEHLCRSAAAANHMTYEEVCAQLEAGYANLRIDFTYFGPGAEIKDVTLREVQGRPIPERR